MKLRILLSILFCASATVASDYNVQTLEKAHTMFRAATNQTLYAEAAREYEYLVKEEGIRNGHLFYTLGNTYFLADDVGRAILNYRRAEKYIPHDADLRYNLAYVREQRVDVIPEKEHSAFVQKFLGWHFKTSAGLRWWIFVLCYLLMWGSWAGIRKSRRNELRIAFALTALLSVVLAVSLLTELVVSRQTEDGVILAGDVLARKGDGEIYAPAFLEPLHAGTEFQLLEKREPWWYIRLADGQACWIPAASADTVGY